MKALSIRQPWAWLILHAGKNIENRSWTTGYRGPVLIHASKGMTKEEYYEGADTLDWIRRGASLPPFHMLERGGIVGIATIAEVLSPLPKRYQHLRPDASRCSYPWHAPDRYGFVLKEARPLRFIPWTGTLGLFEVPDQLVLAGSRTGDAHA